MGHTGEVAIGLDIGGTNMKSGIVNAERVVIHHLNCPTKANEGWEALLSRIAEITKELERYSSDQGWKVKGVGIGTAGQVNSRTGVVMGATANLPGWAGMELGNRLHSMTGLSVLIDNDANAMAFGEDFLLNPVRESLSRQLLPVYRERIREIEVVSASLGDNGGVVGAVAGYFI
ncbi:ROK family protein [Paenibacillus popilliae]|uniref:ROK family protein n=1 Tax=Paenibacillus popilliae TaxID=78057 RepID=A0ABY3AIR4_PAEPP|nr:ROK family protein [Paenibacillus sp. SDF0028]TQR41720.1 ROK family protein [Paenibacillus sp. SDF0028]